MKPLLLAALTLLAISRPMHADSIVLVAGGGTAEIESPATDFRLREPFAAEFLPDGGMVIVEMTAGNRVLKVDTKGVLRVLAGAVEKGFAGDGQPAAAARFNGLHNLVIAPSGDIYLADAWNYRVRKIDGRTGVVSTLAGTRKKGFSGDGGPAATADFGSVINVALDPAGERLYIADIENRRVRRIVLATGVVETVAGNGAKGVPADGAVAKNAPLVDPRAITASADGSFYILERGGHALRHVDAEGLIRTVVGTGKPGLSGDDGPALAAQLRGPKHICLDPQGNVLIADSDNHVIRRYQPANGRIVRVAGIGKQGSAGLGGSPLAVELDKPHGVSVHPSGAIYISDSSNHRILKIAP